jgi:threonine dehydrogenase-like Zn-dependent dehydrogenase
MSPRWRNSSNASRPAHAVRLRRLYSHNVGLRAGIAPVRRYLPELLAAVLGGRFDPSPLLDHAVPPAAVNAGFAAMASRTAIKTLVRVG